LCSTMAGAAPGATRKLRTVITVGWLPSAVTRSLSPNVRTRMGEGPGTSRRRTTLPGCSSKPA
jgi:hypothetical protein